MEVVECFSANCNKRKYRSFFSYSNIKSTIETNYLHNMIIVQATKRGKPHRKRKQVRKLSILDFKRIYFLKGKYGNYGNNDNLFQRTPMMGNLVN